jgi:RimJ/RimL family protein N-acetyltransferase
MSDGPTLATERLLLRRWRSEDAGPFAALNADPRVMEHFPATLTRAQSDALIASNEVCFEQRGFGLWAVEHRADGQLAGMVGLLPVELDLPFRAAVEVGWRLAHQFWGGGLASEAARASLAFGFERLQLRRIVAYTAARNRRSIAVMERIGMRRVAGGEFEHPLIAAGDPLAAHVLYSIKAPLKPSASGSGWR